MHDDKTARPLPEIDEDTAPYWEACAEGRLLLQRCDACQALQTYPRQRCAECWNNDLTWIEASGRATIYSFSIVHRPPPGFEAESPYVLAIVELEEGIRMMTNIIDVAPEDVSIGQAVTVVFEQVTEGVALPKFVVDAAS